MFVVLLRFFVCTHKRNREVLIHAPNPKNNLNLICGLWVGVIQLLSGASLCPHVPGTTAREKYLSKMEVDTPPSAENPYQVKKI